MPPFRSKQPNINWRYAIGELLLIVVGITIAFSLQSWREDVNATSVEQDILQGLLMDFEANLAGIRQRHDIADMRVQAALDLLNFTGPGAEDAADSAVGSAMVSLMGADTLLTPRNSTLDSLINGPGVGILQSLTLRTRLSGWMSFVSEVNRSEQNIRDFYRNDLMPYLYSQIPVRSLDAIRDADLDSGSFPADYSRILTDLRFENLVNELYFLNRTLGARLTSAETELLEIQAMIEAQIE